MRAYLRSYAERFGLLARIRLGTEVVKVAQNDARWRVTVRGAGREDVLDFDFVVVCNGVFSTPRIPAVDGMERFAGRIAHSTSLTDPDLVKDKRVLVVGGGKSALDCAACAASAGRSCTLLFRQAYCDRCLRCHRFGKFYCLGQVFTLGHHTVHQAEGSQFLSERLE